MQKLIKNPRTNTMVPATCLWCNLNLDGNEDGFNSLRCRRLWLAAVEQSHLVQSVRGKA